jgi:hypothetical protein
VNSLLKYYIVGSHISTELPKLTNDLMFEETEMEENILSPVAKVAKPEVLYDRNGRRIRFRRSSSSTATQRSIYRTAIQKGE